MYIGQLQDMTALVCNVGGAVFHTTVEILTKVEGSYFGAPLHKGFVGQSLAFLDIARDGAQFQRVLDYLRFGNLPRDSAGRCHIPRESLVNLSADADFYGLPLLVLEIDQLLKSDMKGMRYLLLKFYRNSSPNDGGLFLKEYSSYEAALAAYNKVKSEYDDYKKCNLGKRNSWFESDGNDREASRNDNDAEEGDGDGPPQKRSRTAAEEAVIAAAAVYERSEYGYDYDGKTVVVQEITDQVSGKVDYQVFEDGNWKRPEGYQLLCLPITQEVGEDGALYECNVRTVPDNREYYW
jgi:hypothetical protein